MTLQEILKDFKQRVFNSPRSFRDWEFKGRVIPKYELLKLAEHYKGLLDAGMYDGALDLEWETGFPPTLFNAELSEHIMEVYSKEGIDKARELINRFSDRGYSNIWLDEMIGLDKINNKTYKNQKGGIRAC